MQVLWLNDNKIGDHGLAALAGALGKGALASLKQLYLAENQIGDAGLSALAEAVGNGALPKCTTISMVGNPASAEAQRGVKDAIASRQ